MPDYGAGQRGLHNVRTVKSTKVAVASNPAVLFVLYAVLFVSLGEQDVAISIHRGARHLPVLGWLPSGITAFLVLVFAASVAGHVTALLLDGLFSFSVRNERQRSERDRRAYLDQFTHTDPGLLEDINCKKDWKIRNLVFQGGGVKGVAYGGVVVALDDVGVLERVERVAGTSAGSTQALMIGLGYSPIENVWELQQFDFAALMDAGSFPLVDVPIRLFSSFGIFAGDVLLSQLKQSVARKLRNPLATFRDAHEYRLAHPGCGIREMYFVATDLSTGFSEVLSFGTTPDMPLAYAVRMSMSIPVFFRSLVYQGKRYVDGGVEDNYPINIFDFRQFLVDQGEINESDEDEEELVYNEETLGFRLESEEDIAILSHRIRPPATPVKRWDVCGFARAMFNALFNVQNTHQLISEGSNRTVFVDNCGISGTDFGLTNADKRKLEESGRTATLNFFRRLTAEDMGGASSGSDAHPPRHS